MDLFFVSDVLTASLFFLLFRVLAGWLLLHWLDSLSDSGDDV
jgi:hypothetical protein